jgi:hypothetical protein
MKSSSPVLISWNKLKSWRVMILFTSVHLFRWHHHPGQLLGSVHLQQLLVSSGPPAVPSAAGPAAPSADSGAQLAGGPVVAGRRVSLSRAKDPTTQVRLESMYMWTVYWLPLQHGLQHFILWTYCPAKSIVIPCGRYCFSVLYIALTQKWDIFSRISVSESPVGEIFRWSGDIND